MIIILNNSKHNRTLTLSQGVPVLFCSPYRLFFLLWFFYPEYRTRPRPLFWIRHWQRSIRYGRTILTARENWWTKSNKKTPKHDAQTCSNQTVTKQQLEFHYNWYHIGVKFRDFNFRVSINSVSIICFQTKTELFCSIFKKICIHTYCFRIIFARSHYNAVSVLKTLLYPQCACSNELMRISMYRPREIGAKLKSHGSVCPPFRILTVEWSGARPCLFWWRLMTPPFSDSIVFSVQTRKTVFSKSIVCKSLHSGESFRMAPFLVIVFGGLVWTGP